MEQLRGVIKKMKNDANRMYLLTTSGLQCKKYFDIFVSHLDKIGLDLNGKLITDNIVGKKQRLR